MKCLSSSLCFLVQTEDIQFLGKILIFDVPICKYCFISCIILYTTHEKGELVSFKLAKTNFLRVEFSCTKCRFRCKLCLDVVDPHLLILESCQLFLFKEFFMKLNIELMIFDHIKLGIPSDCHQHTGKFYLFLSQGAISYFKYCYFLLGFLKRLA